MLGLGIMRTRRPSGGLCMRAITGTWTTLGETSLPDCSLFLKETPTRTPSHTGTCMCVHTARCTRTQMSVNPCATRTPVCALTPRTYRPMHTHTQHSHTDSCTWSRRGLDLMDTGGRGTPGLRMGPREGNREAAVEGVRAAGPGRS